MTPEEKEAAEARKAAVLLLAIGFAFASRVGDMTTARSPIVQFDDAEAFVKEAEARGFDYRELLRG